VSSALLAIASTALPAEVSADDAPAAIRLATYNINWGNPNLEKVGEAIAKANADIVLLQETNQVSERYLSNRFAKVYPYRSFVGYRGEYAAERFGYLSTRPLSDLQFHPPTHGGFGSYFASCQMGGSKVRLVNVHLMPFIARRDEGISGLMQSVQRMEQVHAGEIQEIAR
jgi:endonuclease/exonuclease/phosphatase (EEP) superfamily protein YafD